MENGYENLTIKANRIGTFGDYEMFGLQFENKAAERGWLVTAWLADRDPRTFWVEGEEFASARGHWLINFPSNNLIEILPSEPGIKPEMRKAILRGIAEWEKTPNSA